MQASKIVQPWTHLLFSLLLLLWIFLLLLLLRSFLSSESSIHHLQSRISVTNQQTALRESLDFSLPLTKPRRISFTKKLLKTQFPAKSETTDLLLRSTHLWCWRWKLPESPSPDGACHTTRAQQFRRQRDRHTCFSSFFGRQTLTLMPKAEGLLQINNLFIFNVFPFWVVFCNFC